MVKRMRSPGPVPGIGFERCHWVEGAVVAGVDEVGRGAWAGPVTYAAVVLPTDRRIYGLRDSKRLVPARREHLRSRIQSVATGVGVGHATNDEIDELGMSLAMRTAARRAVDALPTRPDVLLLDGNWDFLADFGTHNVTIPHGDDRSASIAAASIVAKVTRDAIMRSFHPHHPSYGFLHNKGYAAPVHREALLREGPCPLHRRSWAPIVSLSDAEVSDAEVSDAEVSDAEVC